MGAWGPEPFSNDAALDWLHTPIQWLMKSIHDALIGFKQSHGSRSPHEAIAAAQLLIEHTGTDCANSLDLTIAIDMTDGTLYLLAIDALDQILQDTDWINGWKDSNAVMATYHHMRETLRERLATCT
jgi:hypothetical protein